MTTGVSFKSFDQTKDNWEYWVFVEKTWKESIENGLNGFSYWPKNKKHMRKEKKFGNRKGIQKRKKDDFGYYMITKKIFMDWEF